MARILQTSEECVDCCDVFAFARQQLEIHTVSTNFHGNSFFVLFDGFCLYLCDTTYIIHYFRVKVNIPGRLTDRTFF